MMQPHYFAFTFLCILYFQSVLSIQCNDTQYAWTQTLPEVCCEKCAPGSHMVRRLERCKIRCDPCSDNLYSDTYNMEMTCNHCENCDKPNMEYQSRCNATHDAVCRCKAGYECKNQPCKQCLLIPTTIRPTLAPFSTALKHDILTTLWTPQKSPRGIIFAVATKSLPFLRWIESKHGYLLAKSQAPAPPHEEVSKPVQEAGHQTNLKTDPELGLSKYSVVDIK
uniref:CD27 antigen isoform X2 n=1 Tax=Scatophagus argus TaxID=75038 RepID=UPI001ED85523|nr:CD27 antigen isoform X2 [Scatophagus argus]